MDAFFQQKITNLVNSWVTFAQGVTLPTLIAVLVGVGLCLLFPPIKRLVLNYRALFGGIICGMALVFWTPAMAPTAIAFFQSL